ncbi:gene transfer agent family protein [Mesorhizobium sp. DCY119]|uniref:gene transfer agent family protein n=1 Tax=Mesorhizobium sp. DCY119 TaxID=2108445 RepID=UPI000E6C46F3|nr:gene transfer agent family protein [Mesorhizobium sp. DCY119]RJG44920.1 gene transfer agent family protein [Mesorhizobium sp. DCY119]
MKRFFGDAEYNFELTFNLAHSFERDNRKSLFATMNGLIAGDWRVSDVAEIVRLGLVGGGTDEIRSHELVETYVRNRPVAPSANLALEILEAAFFEIEDPAKAEADRVFGKDAA